jgi:BolA protein
MSTRDLITEKLSTGFQPTHLEVVDESSQHQGHAGWREGGETHFRVRIATRQFAGMTRLAQHRAVMTLLDAELKSGVHALAIEVLPPDGPGETPPVIQQD